MSWIPVSKSGEGDMAGDCRATTAPAAEACRRLSIYLVACITQSVPVGTFAMVERPCSSFGAISN